MQTETKREIKRLATQYFAEYHPDDIQVVEDVYDALDEEGFLDGKGVYISAADAHKVIGLAAETLVAYAGIILIGLFTNALYDIMKIGVLSLANNARWKKRQVNDLGEMDEAQAEQARRALEWLLQRLLQEQKNGKRKDGERDHHEDDPQE